VERVAPDGWPPPPKNAAHSDCSKCTPSLIPILNFTASFVYDADSKQVKTIVNGVTTYYVGNHYEVKNSVVTKYRCNGKSRVQGDQKHKRRTG
jgi:hypothetical protein